MVQASLEELLSRETAVFCGDIFLLLAWLGTVEAGHGSRAAAGKAALQRWDSASAFAGRRAEGVMLD